MNSNSILKSVFTLILLLTIAVAGNTLSATAQSEMPTETPTLIQTSTPEEMPTATSTYLPEESPAVTVTAPALEETYPTTSPIPSASMTSSASPVIQVSEEELIKRAVFQSYENTRTYLSQYNQIHVRGYDQDFAVVYLDTIDWFLILLEKQAGQWTIIPPDDVGNFNRVLLSAPEELIYADEKDYYYQPTVNDGGQKSGVRGVLSTSSYSYFFPWYMNQTGRVTQPYNGTFSHSKYKEIDFNTGGSIAAIGDGVVKYAQESGATFCNYINGTGYYPNTSTRCPSTTANIIVLYHPEQKLYSWYLHLKYGTIPDRLLKPGSIVHHGEMIGYQGNTGWTNGTIHLHFAISTDYNIGAGGYPYYRATTTGVTFKNGNEYYKYTDLYYGFSKVSKNDPCENYGSYQGSGFSNPGVALFSEKFCVGDAKAFNEPTNWINFATDFENKSSSIYVSPGWSVLVWNSTIPNNLKSPISSALYRCLTGTSNDLAKINFMKANASTTIPINDQISSIQVFNTSNCTPRAVAIRPILKDSSARYYCLETAGGSLSDGAKLQVSQCVGSNQQLWFKSKPFSLYDVSVVPAQWKNYYAFQNGLSRKCLDVPGGAVWNSPFSPIQMQQWACYDENVNQKWTPVQYVGYILLKNKANSWCLAIEKSPVNGVRVIQRKCNAGDNTQKWEMFGAQ